MQDFRRLRVWHAAHEMSVNVTNSFPELAAGRAPGLRSQIIRSAQSVPSNIAEGCGKALRTEFAHYIGVSISSVNELEGHLLYARDTGQISLPCFERLAPTVIVVRKMLIALLQSVQRQIAQEENDKRTRAASQRRSRPIKRNQRALPTANDTVSPVTPSSHS